MSAPRITVGKTAEFDFFHQIAATGSLENLKQIVEGMGLDINLPHSMQGTPPVYFAAQSGSLANLQYLIENGANLDASHADYNLLFFAAQNKPDVIAYVTNPALEIHQYFLDGTNALSVAIVGKRAEDIKREISRDPHQVVQNTNKGRSPLFWAAYVDNQFALKLLEFELGTLDGQVDYLRGRIEHINWMQHAILGKEDRKFRKELLSIYLKLNKIQPLKASEINRVLQFMMQFGESCLAQGDSAQAKDYFQQALEFALQNRERLIESGKTIDVASIQDQIEKIDAKAEFFASARELGLALKPNPDDDMAFNIITEEVERYIGQAQAANMLGQINGHRARYKAIYDAEYPANKLDNSFFEAQLPFYHALARCFKLNIAIKAENQMSEIIFKCSRANKNIYLFYTNEGGFEVAQRIPTEEDAIIDVLIATTEEDKYIDKEFAVEVLTDVAEKKQPLDKVGNEKMVDVKTNLFGNTSKKSSFVDEDDFDYQDITGYDPDDFDIYDENEEYDEMEIDEKGEKEEYDEKNEKKKESVIPRKGR